MNYRGSILSSTQAIRIICNFILAGLVLWLGVNGALAGDVNPQNRAASRDFFNTYYLAPDAAINWTGDRATCNPGDTDPAFRDAALLRLNYFRAMAGVPATVTFSDTYNAKDQQAALMMSANADISHSPPPTWKCYTADGAEAASKSNLLLGTIGRTAIDRYMRDSGSTNGAVGHRRWILYPQTQLMGTGDIPTGWLANALWVIDSHYGDPRPPTREEFVAWPPPGYVPYQVVYARWSFSYAGANFSSATVTMTQGGASVPVALDTLATGYGENTMVWIPLGLSSSNPWPKPSKDMPYVVTISNVVIGGGTRTFTYTVTVFDPAKAARVPIGTLWLLLD